MMIAKWHIFPVLALALSLLAAGCASSQPKALTGEPSHTQTKQIWMGSRLITTVGVPANESAYEK